MTKSSIDEVGDQHLTEILRQLESVEHQERATQAALRELNANHSEFVQQFNSVMLNGSAGVTVDPDEDLAMSKWGAIHKTLDYLEALYKEECKSQHFEL
jgi:hypothetical protein